MIYVRSKIRTYIVTKLEQKNNFNESSKLNLNTCPCSQNTEKSPHLPSHSKRRWRRRWEPMIYIYIYKKKKWRSTLILLFWLNLNPPPPQRWLWYIEEEACHLDKPHAGTGETGTGE